jgi:hypothetical protein
VKKLWRIVAVIDTNALVDAYSCHDVLAAIDEASKRGGKAKVVADPNVRYRCQRAKEALLLGAYLHRAGATTWSLHSEPVELLTRRVPPGATDTHGLELAYTTVFLHFVKDHVMTAWNVQAPRVPGGEAGNAADRAYLAFAKQHGKPLVTNEGNTPGGIIDEKLRLTAKQQGVPVFTPGEFWAGRSDEAVETKRFLRRFERRAQVYIGRRPQRARKATERAVRFTYGYLRMVLLGEFDLSEVT